MIKFLNAGKMGTEYSHMIAQSCDERVDVTIYRAARHGGKESQADIELNYDQLVSLHKAIGSWLKEHKPASPASLMIGTSL